MTDTLPVTAPDLLQKAAMLMAERAKNYDQPGGERSMADTITAFNAITGFKLKESHGWLMLELLKAKRLETAPGYHADSAEDKIAYAALHAEAKAKEAT
jgi:hypothetical protein